MHDVLIIGAGAAGLMAARILHEAGIEVIVVEARDRIGGRIWTQATHSGVVTELGAEFVHGVPKVTCALLTEAGLETIECADRRLLRDRHQLRPVPEFRDVIARVNGQIDPSCDISYDKLLASARASPREKQIALSYVEGFDAASARLIGTTAIAQSEKAAEEMEGQRQFRLPGGYGNLIDWLAAKLPVERICRGEVVREIHWQKERTRVVMEFGDGIQEREARRVVVTVPLGVLKAAREERGAIQFFPPLADKMGSLERIHMGRVRKIIVTFRECFWAKHRRFDFALGEHAAFPTWWTQEPLYSKSLTGWAGGPTAEKLNGLSPHELLDRAISSLAEIFCESETVLRDLYNGIQYHDWCADPYTRGAYSYLGVGGASAARALARPIDDTLYFAGEATNTRGNSGTVDAALESGLRVAQEILSTR